MSFIQNKVDSKEALWKIRKMIPVGSIFYGDYKPAERYGITRYEMCDLSDYFLSLVEEATTEFLACVETPLKAAGSYYRIFDKYSDQFFLWMDTPEEWYEAYYMLQCAEADERGID